MTEVLLSIVVATYNRLPELQTMLDSLIPQVENQPVEILITDDRSTDETWPWLQTRFAGVQNVHPFRTKNNSGPGPARNLCLDAAKGEYFLPIDSDFIVMEFAVENVLAAIEHYRSHSLLFFPCVQYPSMRRVGKLQGNREICYEQFVMEQVGEVIPVANLRWLKSRQLSYPSFRAGGEGLLWGSMLAEQPGFFIDQTIVLYRTDI